MNKKLIFVCLSLLASVSLADFTWDVRSCEVTEAPTADDNFAMNVKDAVDQAVQPDGYCTVHKPDFPVTNGGMCGGGNSNIGWKFSFQWYTAAAQNVRIQAGFDFGWGGAIWINSNLEHEDHTDIWWSSNWESEDVYDVEADIDAGWAHVTIYGAEGCCDGDQNIRFSIDEGDWQYPSDLVDSLTDDEPTQGVVQHYIESRYRAADDLFDADNLAADFEDFFSSDYPNEDGYCHIDPIDFPISNTADCGGDAHDIAWKYIIEWNSAETTYWDFDFAVSFGLASAVVVDGVATYETTEPIYSVDWYMYDALTAADYWTPGTHTVVFYGHEDGVDQDMYCTFQTWEWSWSYYSMDGWAEELDGAYGDTTTISYRIKTKNIDEFPESAFWWWDDSFDEDAGNLWDESSQSDGTCEVDSYSANWVNSDMCGSDVNDYVAYEVQFSWYSDQTDDWTFYLGATADEGVITWLDDSLLTTQKSAVDWEGDIDHSDVVVDSVTVESGSHKYRALLFVKSAGNTGSNLYVSKNGGTQVKMHYAYTVHSVPQEYEVSTYSEDSSDSGFILEVTSKEVTSVPTFDDDFGANAKDTIENASQDGTNYCTVLNALLPTYNRRLCPGTDVKSNIGWKFQWTWNEVSGNSYQYDLGMDFGHGCAVFVDDDVVLTNNDNLWWNNNWDNSAVQSFDTGYLSIGSHTITVYGFEDCCDGQQDIRFTVNGGSTYWDLNGFSAAWEANNFPICRTFETKYVTETATGTEETFASNLEYIHDQADQPDGYCTISNFAMPISNGLGCGGPSSDISFKYDVKWVNDNQITLDLLLGMDFGRGYAIWMDSALYTYTGDHWWGLNWDNAISLSFTLTAGEHELKIIGSEGCCDGNQEIVYAVDGGEWTSINEMSLNCDDNDDFYSGGDDCEEVTFYSECDFQGLVLEITDEESCLDWSPQSICVPRGKQVRVWDECNYVNQEALFTETVTCIGDIDFALLQSGAKLQEKSSNKVAKDAKVTVFVESL